MKRNTVIGIFSIIISVVIAFSCALISFAEGEPVNQPTPDAVNVNASTKVEETISAIKEVKTELICISKYGNTANFPENSAEGILAAAESGADMILVKVKRTADNQIVLISDSNLADVCVDKDGNPIKKDVSQIDYNELKTYFLRNGKVVTQETMTAYAVPTLKQVIELLDKRAVLLIEDGWEYRNEIYDILSECNALSYNAILTDAKKSSVSRWLSSKQSAPLIVTKYDGTVVWNSRSYIRKSAALGAIGVLLTNNNAYSTTFSKSTVGKTNGKLRAAIDMTDPELCGNRQDTALYWDDVTSRGFSMVITNNIEQFIEYRLRVEESRKTLENLIVKVSEIDLTLFSSASSSALKTSLEKADFAAKNSVSAMELDNAYINLFSAYNNLKENGEKDKGSTTYTSGRIFAAIIVTVVLVLMELAFEVLRNKSIALRKNGKKLFFSNKKKRKKNNTINFE